MLGCYDLVRLADPVARTGWQVSHLLATVRGTLGLAIWGSRWD